MRNVKICTMGGRGVDIKLRSFTDPPADTVYWSPQRYHENGDPAGGCNSFVCVADERGFWRAPSGARVTLVSINGIGEIRWSIEGSHMIHYAEGAVEHFGLVQWEVQS